MTAAFNTDFKGLNVLLVDNVQNIRVTLAAMLSTLGFNKILQAKNGIEALATIEEHPIDIVISEVNLPRLDGIELLIKVRASEAHASMPFIMLSADIEQSEVLRAIRHGVSEYVAKPFSIKILEERIRRALTTPVNQAAGLIKKAESSKSNEIAIDSRKPSILIVDDSPDIIDLVSGLLEKEYTIRAARNGKVALKICESDLSPDLILLDIVMPEMDGMNVCRELKSNPKTQHIDVIFLTAIDDSEKIVKGFALGAVDFVTKPIDPPVLMARVATHLRVNRANKALRNQIDTLIENEKLRDEFESILQSDLKGPLNEIFNQIEFMQSAKSEVKKSQLRIDNLKRSCTLLSQLIDNMLTFRRIENGDFRCTPCQFDLVQLISEVFDLYYVAIQNKQLEQRINLPTQFMVNAEPLLTSSVIANLLNFLVDTAHRGSYISCELVQQEQTASLSLSVSSVLDETIVERFFDKRAVLANTGKHNMYAAKLMASVQRGALELTSDRQSGTQLLFTLPAL